MAKIQRKRRATADADDNDASLTLTAYERIKRAILTMQLRPGEYLNVARLCDQLELGRSPVHQAVHRLALDGLVEIMPRKGVLIRSLSMEDFLQIAEARALLAPALAGLAARRADGKSIARMERILAEVKPERLKRDRLALLQADLAFNGELFAAAGNPLLADMALRLHERALHFLFMPHRSSQELTDAWERLQPVLLAVRNGDESGAQSAMRRYVEAAGFPNDAAASARGVQSPLQ
jgi:DNA-binding GntR family transcriptional regulator